MIRNDVLWKGLIENIFPYFIPFFLPDYVHLFDLSKPVEFLDKELLQIYPELSEQESRFVDKLVKLHTVTGDEKWVLIHIEVQGYNDTQFSDRMFHYFYRILDRYRIPVTAIAIFTDNHKSFAPDVYRYNFAGTELFYRFNTYKILQQDKQALLSSNNPFAIAILTVLVALEKRKLDDNNLLLLKTDLVSQLYSKGFPNGVIRSLLIFIRLYVNFAKPEIADKFETAIEPLIKTTPDMDIFEIGLEVMRQQGVIWGKAEGKVEGSHEKEKFVVENLLLNSDFTDERIAFFAGVPVAFVQEIKSKIRQYK